MSTCRRQGNTYKRHQYLNGRLEMVFPVNAGRCIRCGHPKPRKYRPLVRKTDKLPVTNLALDTPSES